MMQKRLEQKLNSLESRLSAQEYALCDVASQIKRLTDLCRELAKFNDQLVNDLREARQ